MESRGGMTLTGENWRTRRKTCPNALSPPQTRTRAFAVRFPRRNWLRVKWATVSSTEYFLRYHVTTGLKLEFNHRTTWRNVSASYCLKRYYLVWCAEITHLQHWVFPGNIRCLAVTALHIQLNVLRKIAIYIYTINTSFIEDTLMPLADTILVTCK
jgi:hypothetical protein